MNDYDKEALLDAYYNDKLKNKYGNQNREMTSLTIDYLFDCGFSFIEIIQELYRHEEKDILPKNLKSILWNKSLIKRDAFYLHNEVRITSEAPYYDFLKDKEIVPKFYCEMKIRYTVEDLLNYFYSKLSPLSRQLVDKKADIGAVNYFMNKFSNIDWVEPLDIILCSIDYKLKENSEHYRIIDVCQNNKEIIEQLQSEMRELEAKDFRKAVYRHGV
jgi:hypothetical protein